MSHLHNNLNPEIGTDSILPHCSITTVLPAPSAQVSVGQDPPQSAQNPASYGVSNYADGSGHIFSMCLEMATEEDKKMVENASEPSTSSPPPKSDASASPPGDVAVGRTELSYVPSDDLNVRSIPSSTPILDAILPTGLFLFPGHG